MDVAIVMSSTVKSPYKPEAWPYPEYLSFLAFLMMTFSCKMYFIIYSS